MTVAVYAGTFDPPTLGHIDIVKRVVPMFPELHVVIAHNPRKKTLFSAEERAELFREALKGVLPKNAKITVNVHVGLVVDYCKAVGSRVLVRGMRAVSDFEYEWQMASMNRHLAENIETVHIMTDEKYFFVSSSLVKEISHFGGDMASFVPACVVKALKEKQT